MWPRRARKANAMDKLVLPGTPAATQPSATSGPAVQLAGSTRAAALPRVKPAKRGRLQEDILLGLVGVALGLGSAFFPWYVFFNQEKFGIRAVKFDSEIGTVETLSSSSPQITRIADPAEIDEITSIELDDLPVGTTTKEEEQDAQPTGSVAAIIEQPFPVKEANYRVVHIENGRAMIEDESGLWVVQRGSTLPDMTTVTSIEQRANGWVVVTSAKQVLTLSQ